MKRVILGVLALAGFATMAQAADLPRRYEQPVTKAPAYIPVYNWTGPYIGINGGGAWGRSVWTVPGRFDVNGGLIGGTAGYNWQAGQVVFGVEGDIDWTNIRGSVTNAACPLGCTTRNSWLATVRGRLGYSFDRFMPYVTGGLAVGDVKASRPLFAGSSSTETGWTVGGGVEFALAQNWTVKAEYLYVDLGRNNCGFNCSLPVGSNVSFKTNVVRAGLNYRF